MDVESLNSGEIARLLMKERSGQAQQLYVAHYAHQARRCPGIFKTAAEKIGLPAASFMFLATKLGASPCPMVKDMTGSAPKAAWSAATCVTSTTDGLAGLPSTMREG